MHTCITYIQREREKESERDRERESPTDTIHQMKIYCIMISLYFSQVMENQLDNEALSNIFENDIYLLSGGESDTDLLGPDLDVNSHEDIHTMKPFSRLDEMLPRPPIHNSTNTTMSTTLYTITHPLSFMITTT